MGERADPQRRQRSVPAPKHESRSSRRRGSNHLDQPTRLTLGKPGDIYEQEADRIADRVWATPSRLAINGARPRIQRFAGRPVGQAAAVPASVDRVLASSGSPLAPAVRHDVERRFGHDFSSVRVHADPAAEQSARDVDAHAYTVGRDIVFGEGQYAPDTARGRRVLAHELTHVVQQGDGPAAGNVAARLQRQSFSDLLELGAEIAIGPTGASLVRSQKQFIDDLVASIKESPQHVAEFFKDEVWESIKHHWVRIMAVTGGLILAEMAVAGLAAVPEPTLLTKVVAVILQIAIIAIVGYFAAVEVKGAYDEGGRWLATAAKANGNPMLIAEASRSFVRMVWHIVMAVLAVAGVRARIRGATVPRGAAAAGSGASGGAGAAAEGGTVTPISSHPKFQARPQPPAPGQPSASAFGPGGTARKLAPAEQPLPGPVTVPPSPAPAAPSAKAPSKTAGTGPGVQPVPAIGAGVSAGTSERPSFEMVYRGMIDENGLPKVEPSARGLGVRPTTDVTVVSGVVQADARGMSVARVAPGNLPAFRRPPAWGGTGKDPVWAISSAVFQGPLLFAPDTPTHANVAARLPLPLREMQAALAATRPLWVPVPGPAPGP